MQGMPLLLTVSSFKVVHSHGSAWVLAMLNWSMCTCAFGRQVRAGPGAEELEHRHSLLARAAAAALRGPVAHVWQAQAGPGHGGMAGQHAAGVLQV